MAELASEPRRLYLYSQSSDWCSAISFQGQSVSLQVR
jgi:hypothetical protein